MNKELNLAHANLIWSPVAFVDIGVEGAWANPRAICRFCSIGDLYRFSPM